MGRHHYSVVAPFKNVEHLGYIGLSSPHAPYLVTVFLVSRTPWLSHSGGIRIFPNAATILSCSSGAHFTLDNTRMMTYIILFLLVILSDSNDSSACYQNHGWHIN